MSKDISSRLADIIKRAIISQISSTDSSSLLPSVSQPSSSSSLKPSSSFQPSSLRPSSSPIINKCPSPRKNPPEVNHQDPKKRATIDDFINKQDELMQGGGGLTYYQKALTEIQNGLKESCWMWFVIPSDLLGDGTKSSPISKFYGIGPVSENIAKQEHTQKPVTVHDYLDNPTLRCRYVEMLNTIGVKLNEFLLKSQRKPNDLKTKEFLISLMGARVDFYKLISSLRIFYNDLVEKEPVTSEMQLLYETLLYFYFYK
jgi:uncharacterized protein (DUF1810 family)